jgi:hypothetical protein
MWPDRLVSLMKKHGYTEGQNVRLWACKISPTYAAMLAHESKGMVTFTNDYVLFSTPISVNGTVEAQIGTSKDYSGKIRTGTAWASIVENKNGTYTYADSNGVTGNYNAKTGELTQMEKLAPDSKIIQKKVTCIDPQICPQTK